jgi:hypothetical protein
MKCNNKGSYFERNEKYLTILQQRFKGKYDDGVEKRSIGEVIVWSTESDLSMA